MSPDGRAIYTQMLHYADFFAQNRDTRVAVFLETEPTTYPSSLFFDGARAHGVVAGSSPMGPYGAVVSGRDQFAIDVGVPVIDGVYLIDSDANTMKTVSLPLAPIAGVLGVRSTF